MALLSISASALISVAQENKDAGFRPPAASAFPSHQTIGKLKVAAVRYEADEDTKAAFGKVNPNEYGVLPVLLVFQNDGTDTLMLDRMRVLYQIPGAEEIQPTPAKELPFLLGPKRPKTGPSYPVPIPLPKKKNPLTALELDARAFVAKTLLPGDSAHGFLYFETRHQRRAIVYITGIREGSTGKELFYLECPLDAPADAVK